MLCCTKHYIYLPLAFRNGIYICICELNSLMLALLELALSYGVALVDIIITTSMHALLHGTVLMFITPIILICINYSFLRKQNQKLLNNF